MISLGERSSTLRGATGRPRPRNDLAFKRPSRRTLVVSHLERGGSRPVNLGKWHPIINRAGFFGTQDQTSG
jgi:hypothetical protein